MSPNTTPSAAKVRPAVLLLPSGLAVDPLPSIVANCNLQRLLGSNARGGIALQQGAVNAFFQVISEWRPSRHSCLTVAH
jgi:hypothetical protein